MHISVTLIVILSHKCPQYFERLIEKLISKVSRCENTDLINKFEPIFFFIVNNYLPKFEPSKVSH